MRNRFLVQATIAGLLMVGTPQSGWSRGMSAGHARGPAGGYAPVAHLPAGKAGMAAMPGRPMGPMGPHPMPGREAMFAGRPGFDRPMPGFRPMMHPGFAGHPGHIGEYHAGWYHGYWNGHWGGPWRGPWFWGPAAWGFGVGVGAGTVAMASGYYPYYNPFYGPPVVVQYRYLDYSRPIVVAPGPPTISQAALAHFDAARAAFRAGRYQAALGEVDFALRETPNDLAMHEFRGLVLFALRDYRAAAATIYAVLNVGPGWDWTTLSGLYPDRDTYIQQVRALDQYRREHPDSADAHFLLAYHYMTTGNIDAAVIELQEDLRLLPNDRLAQQLLRLVRGDPQPSPNVLPPPVFAGDTPPARPASARGRPASTELPTVDAPPPQPAALVGTWHATRADDHSRFVLTLRDDRTFAWRFTAGDSTQNLTGVYSLEGSLLELKPPDSASMIGRISGSSERQFLFRLVGGPPDDAGLVFRRE